MRISAIAGAAGLLLGTFGLAHAAAAQEAASNPQQVEAQAIYDFEHQNYEAAFKGFHAAEAQTGDAFAQTMLGNMYYYGWGTEKSTSEALRWYQKAAAKGQAEALVRLGEMYFRGAGVTRNYVEAYKLVKVGLERAAPNANAGFRTQAENLLDEIAGNMTSEQINKATVLSRQLKLPAGSSGVA